MAETITVTRAQLADAMNAAKESDARPKTDDALGIAGLIFDHVADGMIPAGEASMAGPDSGITGDDSVDNTAANNG